MSVCARRELHLHNTSTVIREMSKNPCKKYLSSTEKQQQQTKKGNLSKCMKAAEN
jgi:hypothetical protein